MSPTRIEAATGVPPAVAMTLPAVAGSVAEVRASIGSFLRDLELPQSTIHAAEVAVSEAATNVVRHAYAPDSPGTVELHADVEDDALEIVVCDNGRGFLPGTGDGVGAGLALIAEMTDDFAITARKPQGVEIWMRFVLAN